MLKTQIPEYFKVRRQRLTKEYPDAVFLLPAAPEVLRNPDVNYPYRQESNLYYLSGFDEPESFLVLTSQKTVLFVRKRDPVMEVWEGERYGTDRALTIFEVDETYLISELETKLPDLVQGIDKVFYRLGQKHSDALVLSALETARKRMGRSGKPLASIHDPNLVIGEMRLYKSAEEIDLLRKACELSAEAHIEAMKQAKPGKNEFEVEALINFEFRKRGSPRLGYDSIVAGGKNATCLHYRANNETLNDGDLLLVDAGGEYDYYTADITRTFPVGKKFSQPQAEIYDLVLKTQKECVAMAKPGIKLSDIHQHASERLVEGMLAMGLMSGSARDIPEIIKSGKVKRFYPHGTGHWLGMDVHDLGLYQVSGQPRVLEPGMVFTIEPGFYVQPDDTEASEHYRGIGVRIEDNVAITPTGCDVLTRNAPKERAEIEALKQ